MEQVFVYNLYNIVSGIGTYQPPHLIRPAILNIPMLSGSPQCNQVTATFPPHVLVATGIARSHLLGPSMNPPLSRVTPAIHHSRDGQQNN